MPPRRAQAGLEFLVQIVHWLGLLGESGAQIAINL
jgi:hypothetical protein